MAEEVGKSIIASMEGQTVTKYVFKRKSQVKLMGVKIISEGEELVVDPKLMFQRMLMIVNNSNLKLADLFKYELSVYSPSLFTKNGQLNTATRAKFSDALAKICQDNPDITLPKPECNVLDGGLLLQQIP